MTFVIECASDRYGGDLSSANTATFSQCIELCSTTASCLDVSYVGTSCYLKNNLQGVRQNSNVWGARLVTTS